MSVCCSNLYQLGVLSSFLFLVSICSLSDHLQESKRAVFQMVVVVHRENERIQLDYALLVVLDCVEVEVDRRRNFRRLVK